MKRKNLIVIRKVEKENPSIKDFKVKTIYKKYKAIIFNKINIDRLIKVYANVKNKLGFIMHYILKVQ